MTGDPDFLTVEDVIDLHAQQLARYGGADGLRDRGLLESAVATPRASFGGQFAHEDVHAMAAAYAFHIAQNQPFIDGNKRTGLLAALVFLDINAGSSPTRTSACRKPCSRSPIGASTRAASPRSFASSHGP